MTPSQALQHWAQWAVDNGSWRQSCYSVESRYADDRSRYGWPADQELHFRLRYDRRTGEQVERMVAQMLAGERDALRNRFVRCPHLPDHAVAQIMGLSARNFDTLLLAAQTRFGRSWRQATEQMAA